MSTSTSAPLFHRFRASHAATFAALLLIPNLARAIDLSSETAVVYGYDDNVNQKPDCQRLSSRFLSITPTLSVSAEPGDDSFATGGYELSYTHYLDNDRENQVRQLGWYELSQRLQPGLFHHFNGQLESLENRTNPEDDGWGYRLASDLTYHVSEQISTRIGANYAWWRYDNLAFDTGKTLILLEERQVDHRYEGELGLVTMLTLDTRFELAYRMAYNDSNNTIDEYHTSTVLASIHAAVTNHTGVSLEYTLSQWDYSRWRAGKRLKGKLRNDDQARLRLRLEYALRESADLFFDYEMTHNESNLNYQSYDRRLVYGGVRLHW